MPDPHDGEVAAEARRQQPSAQNEDTHPPYPLPRVRPALTRQGCAPQDTAQNRSSPDIHPLIHP
ncbi:hypothetical protein GCM10017687_00350 [Streptomyces echinatus]